MLTIECPWCAAPLAAGDDRADLECDGCSVKIAFAPDPPLAVAMAVALDVAA